MTSKIQPDVARVAIFCTSLKNPFIEAWFKTWEASGAEVAVLAQVDPSDSSDTPDYVDARTVYYDAADSLSSVQWKSDLESLLGGPPTVLFYWWGLSSLLIDAPVRAWPHAKVLLCVDTYPNASRLLTEIREVAQSALAVRRVDAFVVASDEMADLLRRRFPWVRDKPMQVVTSPFPLSTHASSPRFLVANFGKLRLCFTGRSDFLHSGNKKMGKDDLGDFLVELIADGMDVFVQQPHCENQQNELRSRGYSFYPDIPRSGLLGGDFAEMISEFDGHIVYYDVANSTLSRRVSTSLSTRFATGICAPTPIIVPPQSIFANRFLAIHPIGFASSDVSAIRSILQQRAGSMRQYWEDNHHLWAGESNSLNLRQLVEP